MFPYVLASGHLSLLGHSSLICMYMYILLTVGTRVFIYLFHYISFIHPLLSCFSLEKDFSKRPNYAQLLESEFLTEAENRSVDMAAYISHVLDDLPEPPPEKKPDKRR